jgi:hypothetical protein
MLKSIKGKLDCWRGKHDLDEWRFTQDSSCRQVQVCLRPGCKVKNERESHSWSDWQYAREGACRRIKSCARCGGLEEGPTLHQFGDWLYVHDDHRQKSVRQLRQLRQILAARFNLEELRILCFDTGIDYEDLPSEGKNGKAKDIVVLAEKSRLLPRLLALSAQMRPDVDWSAVQPGLGKPGELQSIDLSKLNWELPDEESCHLRRECLRCGFKEDRRDHDWSNEAYEADFSCARVIGCYRCGESQSLAPIHQWGEKEYLRPGACELVSYCLRCGEARQEGEVRHQWKSWQRDFSKCVQVRECSRCGEFETGLPIPHDWGSWEYPSEYACYRARRCLHCNLEETSKEEEHQWGALGKPYDSCALVQACLRCGRQRSSGLSAEHDWEESDVTREYGSEEQIEQEYGKGFRKIKRECKHCGARDYRVEYG